jgi:hypothetical protein
MVIRHNLISKIELCYWKKVHFKHILNFKKTKLNDIIINIRSTAEAVVFLSREGVSVRGIRSVLERWLVCCCYNYNYKKGGGYC